MSQIEVSKEGFDLVCITIDTWQKIENKIKLQVGIMVALPFHGCELMAHARLESNEENTGSRGPDKACNSSL